MRAYVVCIRRIRSSGKGIVKIVRKLDIAFTNLCIYFIRTTLILNASRCNGPVCTVVVRTRVHWIEYRWEFHRLVATERQPTKETVNTFFGVRVAAFEFKCTSLASCDDNNIDDDGDTHFFLVLHGANIAFNLSYMQSFFFRAVQRWQLTHTCEFCSAACERTEDTVNYHNLHGASVS